MADAVRPIPRTLSLLPGLAAALAIATLATLCGRCVPLLGAPIFALAIGIIVAAMLRSTAALRPGVAFASQKVLQAAIVVSGFGLSFQSVLQTGAGTLPVMLVTITLALAVGLVGGRSFGLERIPVVLITVGTAICGASAIGALAAVLAPAEAEVSLAIAVIFCYNLIAVLAFPAIGHALHLSQHTFAIWAGTAINDTSSVVAAGYAYGTPAGIEATIVKLTRSVFILPIVATFALLSVLRHRTERSVPWRNITPWFIGWFLLAALINSTGIVPVTAHPTIEALAIALISIALAAIGLQTNVQAVVRAGWRPLLFGLILWVSVAVSSLLVQHSLGM